MAIIGGYMVIKQIGEGGFARTYLAEHLITKGHGLIKQSLGTKKEDQELFIQEASLLWDIHHYSLPVTRDVIIDEDGSCILILSYVDGVDLEHLVGSKYTHGLDPEHVCWIMQRIANALHYLHSKGVVHNDVKPSNLMVETHKGEASHNIVVVDYGLSVYKPKSGTVCPGYTPRYAAPEQEMGKPPIPETDVYGLGISMIHALGGKDKECPSGTPKLLADLLYKCILRNPMARPNSCYDIVVQLSDIRLSLFGARASGKSLKI